MSGTTDVDLRSSSLHQIEEDGDVTDDAINHENARIQMDDNIKMRKMEIQDEENLRERTLHHEWELSLWDDRSTCGCLRRLLFWTYRALVDTGRYGEHCFFALLTCAVSYSCNASIGDPARCVQVSLTSAACFWISLIALDALFLTCSQRNVPYTGRSKITTNTPLYAVYMLLKACILFAMFVTLCVMYSWCENGNSCDFLAVVNGRG